MSAAVCLLTGQGYGAIGSVLLYGQGAELILSKVFEPAVSFETGGIFHGRIIEEGRILDKVVVGCEGINHFVIHCHGNPILVQKITHLLIRYGAKVETVEQMMMKSTAWAKAHPMGHNLIEREAYVEQVRAVTIEGVKIIQSQIDGGLSAAVKEWLENVDRFSMEEIQKRCREILSHSEIARRIIHGVKIVLAGPANSGKSTLLNTLAGSQKAIVSDIAGTTRDWVSAFIHIGPLRAEMIDTAGLSHDAVHDAVDKKAQQRTMDLIGQCDCALWIVDCINPSKMDIPLPAGMPVIRVLNKTDLLGDKSPEKKSGVISISAKTGGGVENLLSEIQGRLQVCGFDYTLPVAFTTRQEKLLTAIADSKEENQLRLLLTETLNG